MPDRIREIYQQTILPLPERERLKLAALIINDISRESGNGESQKPKRKGDIARFFGMFDSGDPDSADNEKIDADLACAYLEDYERSK